MNSYHPKSQINPWKVSHSILTEIETILLQNKINKRIIVCLCIADEQFDQTGFEIFFNNGKQTREKRMNIKKIKKNKQQNTEKLHAQKSEEAMIAGIIEGSPDAVGVAVIRLACGCRKMAAVDKEGEPASGVIIYRDKAESVCEKCKEDNGDFSRVTEAFIDWCDPEPAADQKKMIEEKVLGTMPITH